MMSKAGSSFCMSTSTFTGTASIPVRTIYYIYNQTITTKKTIVSRNSPGKQSSGRRMCAYAIDAIIAVIPTLILSLVIGGIVLPFILLIYYPSPAVGASAYMSYAAIESLTETKEYEGGVLIQETWKGDRKPNPITSTAAVIALVFYLFHSLVCTLLLRGQTIGKKLMHIEVRRSNTGLAKSRTILGREFLGKMLMNSIPIIPLVYLCTILFTKEHKALHDMLADTIVIDV
ncbi:MAG: RDD family protein [Bacillota bacterium]|nr:RDD family protein [Bacillota bacterium]